MSACSRMIACGFDLSYSTQWWRLGNLLWWLIWMHKVTCQDWINIWNSSHCNCGNCCRWEKFVFQLMVIRWFVLFWTENVIFFKKKKIFKLFKGLKQAKMPRGLIPHQKNWMNILTVFIYLFLKHITSEFEHRAEKEYKKGGMQKLCSQKFEINVLQR